MRVLVAVDRSEESGLALRYACELFRDTDSRVHALHVKPDETSLSPEMFYAPFFDRDSLLHWMDVEAQSVKEQAFSTCEMFASSHLPCWARVVAGNPADEILSAAHMGSYDLVVLGSHGRPVLSSLLFRTIHNKILHHATQPVLLVRGYRPLRRVLIAYRGTSCDQEVLEFISPLLCARSPEVSILHVQESNREESGGEALECLTKGGETLGRLNFRPETVTARGDFVEEVYRMVTAGDYDLIVLGAYDHRKHRLLDMLTDDALSLVRSTSLPVMVYRNGAQN